MENRKVSLRKGILFLILVGTAYGMANFHRTSMSILSPYLIDNMGLDTAQVGLLGAVIFYTYGASQIPIGVFSEKYGAKVVVRVCAFLMVIGNLMFALAENYQMMLFSRIILGVAVSGFFVPGLSLIRDWFLPTEIGFYNSILVTMGTVWTLFSFTPLQYSLERFSIRQIYLFFTLLSLLLFFGMSILYEDKEKLAENKSVKKTKMPKDYLMFLIAVAVFGFIQNGSRQAFQSQWGAVYFIEGFGFSLRQASLILTAFTLTAVFTGPLVGKLSTIVSPRTMAVTQAFTTGIMWIGMGLLPESASPWLVGIYTGIFGGIMIPTMSNVFSMIGDMSTLQYLSLSNGIVNTTNFVGSAVYTQAVGKVLAKTSMGIGVFRNVFFVFALLNIIAAGLVYVTSKNVKGRQASE